MDYFWKVILSVISPQGSTPTKSLQELRSLSLSAFAREICLRLNRMIKALPKERGINAARGLLQTNLTNFEANLITLGDALDDNDAKRTRKALDMLERLCRWPDPYYPAGDTDGSFSPTRYPSLSMLLTSEERVREPLKQFFNDFKLKKTKKFWTQLSASLDAAGNQDAESTLRGPDLSELWERRNTIESRQDKERFIVSLHNSLVKHCHCHCKQACDFMAANIRLNCNDSPPRRTNKVSEFNLLFQDLHDIQDSQSSCYWRDIQISVSATDTTKVTFKENSDNEESEESDNVSEESGVDESYDSVNEGSELLDELRLCQFITEARQNQLQVKLIDSKGELRLKKESIPLRRFLTNVPSTSLANLLHSSKLTDRNKAILSYLLVDAVWQYYDCSWEDWSNNTVQFMSERVGVNDSSEVVFVNQPFLHARFDKRTMLEANDGIMTADKGSVRKGGLKKPQLASNVKRVQERKSHNYPKILALGIMLLEIQLGRKLESFKTSDYFDQDSNIARHLLALDLLKDKKLWPPENSWTVLKEIIEICIDDQKAKATLKNDKLEVRQRIYEHIVAPFRVFILEAWKPKGIEDVDPVTLEKATHHSEKAVTRVTEALSVLNTNEKTLTQSLESSTKWFQNLDQLTEKLSIVGRRDEKKCPQIKIAILDTGITEEYYDEFNEYIEEYKDFVSGKDELRQDGAGHGSTALRLLLKLNDDVKVFVGRVFEHNDADDETERVMAEAIMHAKLEWKVDIICIPSGFNPDLPNPPYRKQLYTAVTANPKRESDPRTLIFAAASNLGFTSEITYPGCLSQSSKVLCLFSTSGDGDPDRPGFNPAAVPNTYNLALLGEGIRIDPTDQPVRGTSYSTIIAGAIAAYIMDFANHADTEGKIRDAWYLREVEGMTSVFASMFAAKKNGYHVLEPWRLMKHYQYRALSKMELRKEMCRNISKALGDRNSRRYL